jgi:hypothetical protein
MEDIKLPRHVIDRLENRWASRLQQDARASDKARLFEALHVRTDSARDVPFTVKRDVLRMPPGARKPQSSQRRKGPHTI